MFSGCCRIHRFDTTIEVCFRKALWKKGCLNRKKYKVLPGSPDIVLTKYKIAIFCDSEFLHGKDWDSLKLRLKKGASRKQETPKIPILFLYIIDCIIDFVILDNLIKFIHTMGFFCQEYHSSSAESHNLYHFPRTACKYQT